MGLDVGIDLALAERATVDCTELADDLLESLVSAFGVSDGRYCIPGVLRDDGHPNTYEISWHVISWGEPLEASSHQVGDLLRVLIRALIDQYDPKDGLTITRWGM